MLLLLAPQALAGPGASGVSVPLYAISEHRCDDPRYPALAGHWAVGCGPDGGVSKVQDLVTGDIFDLPRALTSPGLGPGVLYAPERDGAMVSLGPGGPSELENVPRVNRPAVAPAAVDGTHAAVLVADRVEVLTVGEPVRPTWQTTPRGWEAPALAWPWVAWAADVDGAIDLWWLDVTQGGEPTVLSGGPGDQRLVVGQGHHLAWVEPGRIVVLDTHTMERTPYPAQTGFSAAPTLWGDVACWEDRSGADVDIACTDGVGVGGPGHQRWPSRWDRWLLYRQGETAMLYTAPEPAGDPAEPVVVAP